MIGLRRTPFSTICDRLICIRWPAHVLQHENKAAWFIHHFRELFDLWDTPYRTVPDNAEGRAYRELLRNIDTAGMRESRDFFTNSLVVRDRVRAYNGWTPNRSSRLSVAKHEPVPRRRLWRLHLPARVA